MRIKKCGWENSDDKMKMENKYGKMRMEK